MNITTCKIKDTRLAGAARAGAVARRGARRLSEPLPRSQAVQAQLLCHLCCGHRVGQVLLVGKHGEHCVAHRVLVQTPAAAAT